MCFFATTSGLILCIFSWCSIGASAPPLYSHLDSSGRVFWSPVPPAGDDSAQSAVLHPFYYEPMLVEEAAPILDAAARLAKSAYVNSRMVRK